MRALLATALALALAGCAALDDDSMRPRCRNPNPHDADCSYDISGLTAIARFNESYELTRVRSAVEALSYVVTVANERAVVAERGPEERLTVEAREGWFWLVLQKDFAEPIPGLTAAEAAAEGERACAEGAGAEMERVLAEFEARTGWMRGTWEPCRSNGGVA